MGLMTGGHHPGSDERLIPMRGTRLFVEVFGDPSAPALLYLHGGPGMSCHEFTRWQAGPLSRELWRSSGISHDQKWSYSL